MIPLATRNMSMPILKNNYFLVVLHDQPDAWSNRAKHAQEHLASNRPLTEKGFLGTSKSLFVHALEVFV